MKRTALSLVAGLTIAVLTPGAAVAKDLAQFLGGFETTCSGSRDFVQYMFSLGEKYTITGDRGRRVLIPPELKHSIGQEKVTDKGRYVAVAIPVSGTYRDLPVSRLYFELAHESEHYVAAIVFDASVKAVRSALGSKLPLARRTFQRRNPDYGTYLDILPDDRGAKIHCQVE